MHAAMQGKKIPTRGVRYGGLGRPAPRTAFKPGQSGNPKGRPKGAKDKAGRRSLQNFIIAQSGMTPLEFLTFAYRNTLYDRYSERFAADGKTVIYEPHPEAKRIDVPLQLRVSCALGAAPYVHKKMPVGIEVKEKNSAIISTEKLRSMSTDKLKQLLDFMDQFGLSVDLASTGEVSALPSPNEDDPE